MSYSGDSDSPEASKNPFPQPESRWAGRAIQPNYRGVKTALLLRLSSEAQSKEADRATDLLGLHPIHLSEQLL